MHGLGPSKRDARGELVRRTEYYGDAITYTGTFVAKSTVCLNLMVDANHCIKAQSNSPAIRQSGNLLRSSAAASAWEEVGKSTYRVYVRFRNSQTNDWERLVYEGSAVHIGEGLFLSAVHMFHWFVSSGYGPRTHKAAIYLRSGSGDLGSRGAPGLLSESIGADIRCEPVQWPTRILADCLTQGFPVTGGLLDERYTVPVEADFVLLKARPKKWLARLRREARPYVIPGGLRADPARVDITLVGVNSQAKFNDYKKYDPQVNTPEHYNAVTAALLPDHISYCSTAEGTKVTSRPTTYLLAGAGTAPDVLRYPLSSLEGSSGSGLYDTQTKHLVGLHSRSEVDKPPRLPGVFTNWSEENRGLGVGLDGETFRQFIAAAIVPELRAIGTATATKIAADWWTLCGEEKKPTEG
ncbi:hypothetical protein BDZ91DRAFT_795376 [Kalaharituber pfeilii]|nr:hypothetical protein BDZ91DRAFT_795376 [Kalaharituber pfeilii]